MKNIRITSSCLLNGQHVEVGTVLNNVPAQAAADLIYTGRAVVLEHREPVLEHRDPKPAKPSKKQVDPAAGSV